MYHPTSSKTPLIISSKLECDKVAPSKYFGATFRMSERTYRFAGINFDHMHMGDLLRLVQQHPGAEIVGIADDDLPRTQSVCENLGIAPELQFTDFRRCIEVTRPDVVILCSKTAEHADYVEAVAPYGVDVLVEKPFAASLQEADRMIAAMQKTGRTMIINWPLAWYPPHLTAKRLLDEGVIGDLLEVHYYDGNRGPLRHVADKVEVGEEEANRLKSESWWYQKSSGGGSLLDYLGYGTTLGTWYHNNVAPLEVTCTIDERPGLEVDEHSITVARYAVGLSKLETRWGTFTDPWITQPQPRCGFVLMGTKGTIANYDYQQTISLQTVERPEAHNVAVDVSPPEMQNVISHLLHHFETGASLHGPLRPDVCRVGQQIVDSAALSAREKRTIKLLN
jgi:predicted dehydrogenase